MLVLASDAGNSEIQTRAVTVNVLITANKWKPLLYLAGLSGMGGSDYSKAWKRLPLCCSYLFEVTKNGPRINACGSRHALKYCICINTDPNCFAPLLLPALVNVVCFCVSHSMASS